MDSDYDPYALRPNAPIAVVQAAKASLRDPTRPQTPSSDFGRQLFTRDSDFAQNRPSSAYGVPGSKLFFENGPKLSIARLDPYARSENAPGSLGGRRGSILEQGLGGAGDGRRSCGSRSMLRSSSQDHDRRVSESLGRVSESLGDGGGLLLQHQASRGRPTAAETVQALKANIAAAEMGYRSPHEIFDVDTPGCYAEGSRPSPSQPRPLSAQGGSGPLDGYSPDHTHGWISNGDMGAGGPGAQVLSIQQYSDSSESDDDSDSQDRYSFGRQCSSRRGTSGTAPGTTEQQQQQQQQQQEPVVLDISDAFVVWRKDTEAALQQLATATAALAAAANGAGGPQGAGGNGRPGTASGRGAGTGTGVGGAGSVGKQEALAEVLTACSRVLACAVAMRNSANPSQWLNSSSVVYMDSRGVLLTMREAITEHVFRLMDSHSSELLLRACSVLLRVVRSRQPLLQAGKLLYRLSKDSAHDTLFRREALLEPMLRTIHVMVASSDKAHAARPDSHPQTPSTPPTPGMPATAAAPEQTKQHSAAQQNLYEPLVYYCGALKNVSNDASNQRALVKAGALHVLCGALASMVAHVPSTHACGERGGSPPAAAGAGSSSGPAQVAVQVTGVLRNLAVSPVHAAAFLSAGALPVLKAAMRRLGGTQELALNLGRVLSKLTLSDQFQVVFESDPEYAPLLVSLLGQYVAHGPMLLRLAFVLGNLTTTSDVYRMQVSQVPGSLDLIVSALQSYAAGTEGMAAGTATTLSPPAKRPSASHSASREDCLVKLLRLVANLAINPKVGPGLASRAPLAACLLSLLDSHEYAGEAEELVLNAVCAVTNLSFYQGPENQLLAVEPSRLLRPITPLLLVDNEEAVVEAARAFGNLSRAPAAREYLVNARVLEALVLLLDHSSAEVLFSVCGTLINFSADTGRQGELVRLHAPERLVDVLTRCVAAQPTGDMEVGTLCAVCKALFNLCADGAQSSGLATQDLSPLKAVLTSIQQSQQLMARKEVPQVTARLSALVTRLQTNGVCT